MALQDINWGFALIGAAAVTGVVAATYTTAVLPLAAAAVVGAGLGQWANNVIERTQDAAVALVHR